MNKHAMLDSIRKIVASRDAGVALFDYRDRTESMNFEPSTWLDDYTQALNSQHQTIGDQWRSIDRDAASSIISNLLHLDLAYRVQVMPFSEAQQGAQLIIGLFNNDAQFFTNGDWSANPKERLQHWMPLTQHTFDSGIVACDDEHVACFWVADED